MHIVLISLSSIHSPEISHIPFLTLIYIDSTLRPTLQLLTTVEMNSTSPVLQTDST